MVYCAGSAVGGAKLSLLGKNSKITFNVCQKIGDKLRAMNPHN